VEVDKGEELFIALNVMVVVLAVVIYIKVIP
jgi:hypothetical protein